MACQVGTSSAVARPAASAQINTSQEIEGQRLLTAELVNKLASFLVDLAQRGRPQALKEAEDQVAFLRGHGCLLLSGSNPIDRWESNPT